MSKNTKLSVIKEIIEWKTFDEWTRLMNIQSYLLGWMTEEQIHNLTEWDRMFSTCPKGENR